MGRNAKVQSKISVNQHNYKDSAHKESYRALSELISIAKEAIQEESYQKPDSIRKYLIEDAIWEVEISEDSSQEDNDLTTDDATEESSEDLFEDYSTSLEFVWDEDSSEDAVSKPYDANRFFSNSKPQSVSYHMLQELKNFKF